MPEIGAVFERLNVLEPPFNVPAVLVQVPVKVCVNEVPRFKVPPVPLIVKPAPFTFPVNVAVPAVLVIDTVPVVVKSSIFCGVIVPAIVIPPAPLVSVPAFIKSPLNVIRFAPGVSIAPVFIFNGTLLVLFPITTTPGVVIAPLFFIIIPPVATNGEIHSSVVAV